MEGGTGSIPQGAESLTSWPVTPAATTASPPCKLEPPMKRPRGPNSRQASSRATKREAMVPQGLRDVRVANVALVQWWRRECRAGTPVSDRMKRQVEGLRSPLSMVLFLARIEEGKRVLETTRDRLVAHCMGVGWLDDETACTLATYHSLLGDAAAGVEVLSSCRHLPPESQVLLHQLRMQVCAHLRREEREARAVMAGSIGVRSDVSVDCVSVDDLSYERFYNAYATKSKPVVIRGAGHRMVDAPWTMAFLKEAIGSKRVDLRRRVEGSLAWAGLEEGGSTTVGDFIDKVVASSGGEMEYLFDWSIPLFAPELLDSVVMPKYFAADWLQRTPPGTRYQDSWPSLFIGSAGTTSGLHVDTFHSNFYMAVLQGRKEWVFFSESDAALLYPSYQISTDPAFPHDVLHPDSSDRFPAARLAERMRCTVGPGDLLFVPAGCPHTVTNLTNTVAVSGNYVDGSNIDGVREYLKHSSLTDPMDKQLLDALCDPALDTSMDMDQKDLPWAQFKRHAGKHCGEQHGP